MGWIATIIIGFFVGLLARFFKPGNDKMGFILTTLVGIGGALLATFAGKALNVYQPDEAAGFIASVLGAIVLLIIIKSINKK